MKNEEFIQEFVDETNVHLEKIESNILDLEKDPENDNIINTIFRAMHSIKGTASFFGFKPIVEISHNAENLFGLIRKKEININSKIIDITFEYLDIIKQLLENLNTQENVDISNLKNKFNNIITDSSESVKIEEKNKIDIKVKDENQKEVKINSNQNVAVKYALSHGHKLYKIKLNLVEDVTPNSLSPITFFKKIESIGIIIDSYTDITDIKGLDQLEDSEISYIFIFSTVLEKHLVSSALEINKEKIIELDVNITENEMKTILMDNKKDNIKNDEEIDEEYDEKLEINEDINEDDENNKTEGNKNPKKMISAAEQPKIEETVRVSVSLLNDLMDLASEMVLGRNQLLRKISDYNTEIEGLEPILQNVDLTTTELQGKIMQTRMQPISKIFNKFPRIIREMSKNLDKEIELKMTGTEVELDKSIIESLTDPLTHLVRNSVDHGIEEPSERKKSGKKPVGTVHLKAYHEGGRVNIEIIDDGKGLNIDAIKQKAIKSKVVTENELNAMNEKEVINLIFQPGFSTAKKVTDISGRGVGMDVVKTNIEKLGGTIDVITNLGKGSTFKLIVPLTVAIISSLIVGIKGHKFAFPQVNLKEIYRLKEDDKNKIEHVGNAKVFRLRGNLLPLVDLSELLNIKETEENKNNRTNKKINRILVIDLGLKTYGLIVDAIHESEEILVKSLPTYFKHSESYSGVTIMGDGKIAMILDPEGIANNAHLKYMEEIITKKEKTETKIDDYKTKQETQNLLLFKGTGEETLAVDLSMVTRVEEIRKSDIEKIGEHHYIEYEGGEFRVIRPEDYLPLNKKESAKEKLYVIIPKFTKHPVGILMDEIQDTYETKLNFNQEDHKKAIKGQGILGTTIINKKIVVVLNIFEFFEKAAPEFFETGSEFKSEEKLNVLLLEDTEFFLKFEKSYLEWANYNVIVANNGKEGIQKLKTNQVDAIVSDIVMPEMGGEEFIKWLRKQEKYKHLPAVAVTSLTGEKTKEEILNAGFDYYETKLDKETLLKALKRAIIEKGGVKS